MSFSIFSAIFVLLYQQILEGIKGVDKRIDLKELWNFIAIVVLFFSASMFLYMMMIKLIYKIELSTWDYITIFVLASGSIFKMDASPLIKRFTDKLGFTHDEE